MTELLIDGERTWSYEDYVPYKFIQPDEPLPSDSKWRADLQALIDGDEKLSESEKERMEEE